jgi:hypothetical protein
MAHFRVCLEPAFREMALLAMNDGQAMPQKRPPPNKTSGWRPDHAFYSFGMATRGHPEPSTPCIEMHG